MPYPKTPDSYPVCKKEGKVCRGCDNPIAIGQAYHSTADCHYHETCWVEHAKEYNANIPHVLLYNYLKEHGPCFLSEIDLPSYTIRSGYMHYTEEICCIRFDKKHHGYGTIYYLRDQEERAIKRLRGSGRISVSGALSRSLGGRAVMPKYNRTKLVCVHCGCVGCDGDCAKRMRTSV